MTDLLVNACAYLVFVPTPKVVPPVAEPAAGTAGPRNAFAKALASYRASSNTLRPTTASKKKTKGVSQSAVSQAAALAQENAVWATLEYKNFEDTVRGEVDAFFTPVAAGTTNVKHFYDDFWKEHKRDLPTLWKLARTALSTQATSIAVESMFSVMKSIDAPRRSRLNLNRLCAITLVNMRRNVNQNSGKKFPDHPELGKEYTMDNIQASAQLPSDEEIDDALGEAEDAQDPPTDAEDEAAASDDDEELL